MLEVNPPFVSYIDIIDSLVRRLYAANMRQQAEASGALELTSGSVTSLSLVSIWCRFLDSTRQT